MIALWSLEVLHPPPCHIVMLVSLSPSPRCVCVCVSQKGLKVTRMAKIKVRKLHDSQSPRALGNYKLVPAYYFSNRDEVGRQKIPKASQQRPHTQLSPNIWSVHRHPWVSYEQGITFSSVKSTWIKTGALWWAPVVHGECDTGTGMYPGFATGSHRL